MSLNANAIASMDEAREELRETSQKYDAVLERRINALSQIFEKQSGLILVQKTLTGFRVNGSGCEALMVPLLPLQSVSKIDMRYDFDDSSYIDPITDTTTFIVKDKDEYGHSHTGYLQLLLTGSIYWFPPGKNNILLDTIVGYASTHPVRAEVQRLFFMQLSYEYRRWQQNETGLLGRTQSDGNVSFAIPHNLLQEVVEGLDSLRIRRL